MRPQIRYILLLQILAATSSDKAEAQQHEHVQQMFITSVTHYFLDFSLKTRLGCSWCLVAV